MRCIHKTYLSTLVDSSTGHNFRPIAGSNYDNWLVLADNQYGIQKEGSAESVVEDVGKD